MSKADASYLIGAGEDTIPLDSGLFTIRHRDIIALNDTHTTVSAATKPSDDT
jgi:hypothetical protein